ncbi:hypothetical protein ICM05_04695 [Leucobacter sp. cx-42]|uniref:hypothetical protein n=1 Tax=unclassified Leucobacter TaxID=2621730 RepID=UPI00165DF89E|nr:MULTISPECIES: hypothetical protein [unclassified Leucobacter]MBC9953943.1 hypothetical protein [Leucobacter sp. cx-42]
MNIDDKIRALDAAATHPDVRQRAAADRLLEEIVSAPPKRRQRLRERPRAGLTMRVGVVVALGACAAVAMLVLPQQGSAKVPAIATWTATTEPVTPIELDVAREACRATLAEFDLEIPKSPTTVLSERRGDLIGLTLWGADPETVLTCLVELPPGASRVLAATGGAELGDSAAPASPPGNMVGGVVWDLDLAGGKASIASGAVGPDVSAVTVRFGDTAVQATVADGRYAAWWPTSDLRLFSSPHPFGQITFDLTLTDGTTKTGVQPLSPEEAEEWSSPTGE